METSHLSGRALHNDHTFGLECHLRVLSEVPQVLTLCNQLYSFPYLSEESRFQLYRGKAIIVSYSLKKRL